MLRLDQKQTNGQSAKIITGVERLLLDGSEENCTLHSHRSHKDFGSQDFFSCRLCLASLKFLK